MSIGTPKCLTGIDTGFKASQKTGPRLKVLHDRLGRPGIELRTPTYKASDLPTTLWWFSLFLFWYSEEPFKNIFLDICVNDNLLSALQFYHMTLLLFNG